MKTNAILAGTLAALVFAGSARGQFVPGHVFVAELPGKVCKLAEGFGSDRIWEIDPQTGEASLFVEIPPEMCGFMTGLAFTPDGTRLRGASFLRNEILEFDSEGNITIVLELSDGIAAPWGFNGLAYDANGNFYVGQAAGNILRFPVDGGPATVFADVLDCGSPNAIALAADGDLYCATTMFSNHHLRRMTPDGNAFPFETFGSTVPIHTVTTDDSGHVYVVVETAGALTSSIFRYQAGDPESRELLTLIPIGGRNSMTMSLDQSKIYINSISGVLEIDVADATVGVLFEIPFNLFGRPGGIAVVPSPPPSPPIPTMTEWGMILMTLLTLTAGTIGIQRHRSVFG